MCFVAKLGTKMNRKLENIIQFIIILSAVILAGAGFACLIIALHYMWITVIA